MTLPILGNNIKQLIMLIKWIENNHPEQNRQKIFLSTLKI